VVTPLLVSVYVLLCLVVGFAGRQRAFGFWGFLFFSMLVTPVIGTLALIGASPYPTQAKDPRRP
jgi:hypothetical protein